MPKLGVNIDHVATLRQARRELFPDVVQAALACEAGGADGIVCHLREDRRHIQDKDVYDLRRTIKTKLDLEMASTEEMLGIALKVKPELVTLVPEKRQELTTEGGLDVVANLKTLREFVPKLQDAGIKVSLFIDPVPSQIEASAETGADFIEIHTGAYALPQADKVSRLKEIVFAAELAKKLGLRVNVGHGLDYDNVKPLTGIKEIEEYNIGFSIIARAVFVGLEQAVRQMKQILS